jgi:hypothetical protein
MGAAIKDPQSAINHFEDCLTRLEQARAAFEEADVYRAYLARYPPIDAEEAADDQDAEADWVLAKDVRDRCADALYAAAMDAWNNHAHVLAHNYLARCGADYLEEKAYRDAAVQAKDLERAADVAAGNEWKYKQGRGLPDEVDEIRIARGTLVWQR